MFPDSIQEVKVNTAYRACISSEGEQDWYRFSIEPNKRYYITVFTGTLKDTQLRAYLIKANDVIVPLNNTDAPIEWNLGYGSGMIIEAIPDNVYPIKMGHSLAPREIKFFIEQQDLKPVTGTYIFKIFVQDMPKELNGSYNYSKPLSGILFNGPVPVPTNIIDLNSMPEEPEQEPEQNTILGDLVQAIVIELLEYVLKQIRNK